VRERRFEGTVSVAEEEQGEVPHRVVPRSVPHGCTDGYAEWNLLGNTCGLVLLRTASNGRRRM